jgi:hypothetical protein
MVLILILLIDGSRSIVRTIIIVVVGVIIASTGFELVPPVDLLRLDVIGVRGKKELILFTGTVKR